MLFGKSCNSFHSSLIAYYMTMYILLLWSYTAQDAGANLRQSTTCTDLPKVFLIYFSSLAPFALGITIFLGRKSNPSPSNAFKFDCGTIGEGFIIITVLLYLIAHIWGIIEYFTLQTHDSDCWKEIREKGSPLFEIGSQVFALTCVSISTIAFVKGTFIDGLIPLFLYCGCPSENFDGRYTKLSGYADQEEL